MSDSSSGENQPDLPNQGAAIGPASVEEANESNEQRRRELADFLRTRREKLKPEQVGISPLTRRRTPGLRREEVAELAGVGTTWYTWLEQARDIQPSSEVLRRLGVALQLNPAEMRHLFLLAGKAMKATIEPDSELVSDSLHRLLNALNVPALVLGHRWDVLAANREMSELLPKLFANPPTARNWLRHIFLGDAVDKLEGWDTHARRVVAEFRASVSDTLDSPWVSAFVETMKNESPQFAQWWRAHDVSDRNPVFIRTARGPNGNVILERTILRTSEEPKLTVLIFTPTN